nr:hypothetical protein [uncultured Roseateles sp.]
MPSQNQAISKLRRSNGFILPSDELPFDRDGTAPEGINGQTDMALRSVTATLKNVALQLVDSMQATSHLTDPPVFRIGITAPAAERLRH